VTIDNYRGARSATEHLLSLGRRRIGHITGPLDWWESHQRQLGWQEALLAAGIELEQRMIAEGNWSSKSGKIAFDQLLSVYPEIDAIFVGNDQMALSVLQTACERGIRVPDDLAVAGFDDIPEAAYFCPPLTTVFQNQHELGSIAVQVLAKHVEEWKLERKKVEPIYLVLQPELIIRESTVRSDGKRR
jgi:DNA-binding LacI/PurR family transcriptional regulator